METKRNQKYFGSSGVNVPLLVGLAVAVIGIALLFVHNTRDFGLIIIIVGAAVAVFASGSKSGESDIDNQIMGITKDMPEQAQIKYEVFERNFLTIIKPIFLRGFDYTGDISCKKGPDHKYRTSDYNAAQLYFTNDKIYIYGKHICLVDSSEEKNYEFGGSYAYGEIDKAYVEDQDYDYNGRNVSIHFFGIKNVKGEDIIRFTVEYGADIDKAVDDINHVVGKMTERAKDRAADREAKRAALHEKEAEAAQTE